MLRQRRCRCQLGFDPPNLSKGWSYAGRAAPALPTRQRTPLPRPGLEVSAPRTGSGDRAVAPLWRGVSRGIACIRADASLFVRTR